MLLQQALSAILKNLPEGQELRVLDLCAAPGGKSTLALSALPENTFFVANEAISLRANILSENVLKWGKPNTVVTSNFPADFAPLHHFFDIIIADVPCSGEGMFRKEQAAIDQWTPEYVQKCAKLQREIIAQIADTLRPGGFLVYSTCTFNSHEDEENVAFCCQEFPARLVPIPMEESWGVVETAACNYHCFPHRCKGEGFFLALMQKEGEYTAPKPKKSKGKERRSAPPAEVAELRKWLRDETDLTFSCNEANQQFNAFPAHLQQACQEFQKARLNQLHHGIPAAIKKGKKLQPLQALALSNRLQPESFPRHAVSKEEAIAYLRTEAFVLPPSVPRGYVLLTFEGVPLGFVNNLGNRANNLYPSEWRIRSTHTSES